MHDPGGMAEPATEGEEVLLHSSGSAGSLVFTPNGLQRLWSLARPLLWVLHQQIFFPYLMVEHGGLFGRLCCLTFLSLSLCFFLSCSGRYALALDKGIIPL